jgi:uncharacterized protein
MERKIPGRIKKLAEKVKMAYVATSSKEGIPHLAASEGMTFLEQDRIFFRAWFCIRTIENLQENPKLALAILDPDTGEGYQLLSEMERIDRMATLDGYSPETAKKWAGLPQDEHQLRIRVKEVLHLTSGPHSDEPLE